MLVREISASENQCGRITEKLSNDDEKSKCLINETNLKTFWFQMSWQFYQ